MPAPGAPWRVEREDQEDGTISYHVWSSHPVQWLFTVPENDTGNAKDIAAKIVNCVNEIAVLENLAHDSRVSSEGIGMRVRSLAAATS